MFYFVGERAFASLEEAQKEDHLKRMFAEDETILSDHREIFCGFILNNAKELVDMLTTTPRSRLNGRKSHGAKRAPRKPKAAAAAPAETKAA